MNLTPLYGVIPKDENWIIIFKEQTEGKRHMKGCLRGKGPFPKHIDIPVFHLDEMSKWLFAKIGNLSRPAEENSRYKGDMNSFMEAAKAAGVTITHSNKVIMTNEHGQWDTFRYQLAMALHTHSPTGWKCEHKTDTTRNLLSKINGVDVQASIDHFAGLGGICDCEILLNCQ